MKNDKMKDLFKENFAQNAPENFTQNLMSKIEATSTPYSSIIPKPVLWAIGIGGISLIILIILLMPDNETQLPIQQIIQAFNNIVSMLILPMVVLSLYFIKSIFDYSRVKNL